MPDHEVQPEDEGLIEGFHPIDQTTAYTLRDAHDFVRQTGTPYDQLDRLFGEGIEPKLGERETLAIAGLVWISERRHRPEMTFGEALDMPITTFAELAKIAETLIPPQMPG